MRLASRIFLTTALVIVVLVAVAAWSLVAMDQLIAANREIVTRMVPALRLESGLQESVLSLLRLDTRYAVLHDEAYRTLWKTRAERARADLGAIRPLLPSVAEVKWHRKAMVAFDEYRRRVEAQHAQDDDEHRGGAGDDGIRVAGARLQHSLDRLQHATYALLDRSQRAAGRLEQRTWRAITTALPATVLFVLFTAALLALRLTRSLARLSGATSELASGSFHPVAVSGRDEIATLATAFNQMAERLREVDRLKEEFFSHISHELRTPLTAVREATQLLRDEVPGALAPKQARLVDIIGDNTERVLRLVNQILDLARLQAGLLGIDRRPVDLTRVVHRAVDQVRPQAEARQVALDTNGAAPSEVLGDEERLQQLVMNLVGNAIRFTPAGGAVWLRIAQRPGDVELVVEDTGPGIPADALPRVFDRFWQARGTRGGTGLGLAIVKSIAELHGGRVHAESSDGRGSRFVVHLPAADQIA